jgi:hypothetical protein
MLAVKHQRKGKIKMAKSKKSLGFRMGKEEETQEYWDVYPTHIYIPNDYWTVSTTTDVFNKKKTRKRKK